MEATKAKQTIAELSTKTQKASEGKFVTYSFDGAITMHEPGRHTTFSDEKRTEFNELVSLEKERKYTELTSFCKRQIAAAPEWLTPYLFLGVAQANMGQKEEAITNIKYVISKAPYEPEYQQAKKLIEQLTKSK